MIAAMQKEGLIRDVGLSEVNVEEIGAVLNHGEANDIGFIPWFPLAAGELVAAGSVLTKIASRVDAGNGQVALAWLLKRSPVMLPIPVPPAPSTCGRT